MSENYNAPLLSSGQDSDAYPAQQAGQPVDQSHNQPPVYGQPQYGHPMNQPINQPMYAQPMQQPMYGQPVYAQPQYGQPVPHGYDPAMNQPMNQAVHPVYGGPVVIAQPVPGQPGNIATFGQWSDGLFDCASSPMICFLSWLVPCYRWPVTVARVGLMSLGMAALLYGGCMLATYVCSIVYSSVYSEYALSETDRSLPTGALILQFVSGIAGIITVALGAYHRQKIRARYQIVGSNFGDVCTYLWCSCCAIAQEARHVDRDYGLMV